MTFLRRKATQRQEEGIVLVLVTLALVMFIAITALVLDLGNAYSSSRQQQNAADAAAIAAATELECIKFSPLPLNPGCQDFPVTILDASDVATVANTVAVQDGANAAQITCYIISAYDPTLPAPHYTRIAPCTSTGSWIVDGAVLTIADGVYVEAGNTQQTHFAPAVQQQTQTSENRQAAATIQPLAVSTSPIAACYEEFGDGTNTNNYNNGSTQPAGTNPEPNLLIPSTVAVPVKDFIWGGIGNPDPASEGPAPTGFVGPSGTTAPYYGYQLNPPAVYPKTPDGDADDTGTLAYDTDGPDGDPIYEVLASNAGNSKNSIDRCLVGSDWKGRTGSNNFSVPNWVPSSNGVRNGPIRGSIAGAPGCNVGGVTPSVGCELAVPICVPNVSGATPPSGLSNPIYCVTFGAFKFVGFGLTSNDWLFEFLGFAAGTGPGGQGTPNASSVNVVNLIQ